MGRSPLPLIENHLRRRFARFNLRGHFLQARSKRFNLLLLLRDHCFLLRIGERTVRPGPVILQGIFGDIDTEIDFARHKQIGLNSAL